MMKTSILVGLLTAVAGLISVAAFGNDDKPVKAPEPPSVVASELKPELDGKEVTMTFEVKEMYVMNRKVPGDGIPSFGIRPATKDGSPTFSVVISGDLADLMHRFDIGVPGTSLTGRIIQVSGKIAVSAPKDGDADRVPSYQLTVTDWKRFRLLPSVRIAERLQKKISVNFQREPLYRAVEFVARETGVPIALDGPGMKEVGVTQNVYQNFSAENVPATEVLGKMLNANRLVLIVDEAKKTATITGILAAERTRQTAVPFEPAPQK